MINKRKYMLLCIICIIMVTLTSCNNSALVNSEQNHREYLAVKLPSRMNFWTIIDKNGNVVEETSFSTNSSSISNIYDDVYWVRSNGRCQLFSITQPNVPLLDEEYASVGDFAYSDCSFVATRNMPIRIINTKGEFVAAMPEQIKSATSFSEDGYAIIEDQKGKCGVVDKNGTIIIEPIYNRIMIMNDGRFLTDGNLIIDVQGQVVGTIDSKMQPICNISDGKMVVCNLYSTNDPCYILNTKGENIGTITQNFNKYGLLQGYIDDYLVISDNRGKFSVVDGNGDTVIFPDYDMLINLGKGEFAAVKNNRCGIINVRNEVVINFDYDGYGQSRTFGAFDKIGDNFIMVKNYDSIIVDRTGKELASFKDYGMQMHLIVYKQ